MARTLNRPGVQVARRPPAPPTVAGGPDRAPRTTSREWPFVLALAAVSAVAVLIVTRHHVEIDPDSVAYVAGARNLAHGRGYTDFTGHALTVFPPGYPVLLSIAEFLGVSVWTVGRFLGAFTEAVTVVLAYLLLRRHVRSKSLIAGGTILVAASTQLLLLNASIASDPLFIALTTAVILLLDRICTLDPVTTPGARRNALLVAAGGLVGVSFLVRYAASALLVAGVLALFLLFVGDGLLPAIRRCAWFAGSALVVPLLWILHNAVSDNPDVLGIRVRSYDSPSSLVKGYLHGAASIVLPRSVTTNPAILFLLAVAALTVAVGWSVRRELFARVLFEGRTLVPLVTVTVVFAAFVLASEKLAGIDKSPRQLLPVWPAVVTIGAVFFDWLLDASPRHGWHWRAVQAVAALAVVFVVASVAWFARQLGPGTPTAYLANSATDVQLRRAVHGIPVSQLLMSNDPWRIYLETGREPVQLAPIPITPTFSFRPMTDAAVLAATCSHPVDLIWFDTGPATGSRPVGDLVGREHFTLTRVQRLPGAAVYRVTPARARAAHCAS